MARTIKPTRTCVPRQDQQEEAEMNPENYEHVLAVWGARKLHEYIPRALFDPATVRVETTTIEEGGCETCWYTTAGFTVRGLDGKGKMHSIDLSMEFADVLRELVQIDVGA